MFKKKWQGLGHTEDDILIKRVSTELQAFVELDPELEARVMEEVAKDEGNGVKLDVPKTSKDPNAPD